MTPELRAALLDAMEDSLTWGEAVDAIAPIIDAAIVEAHQRQDIVSYAIGHASGARDALEAAADDVDDELDRETTAAIVERWLRARANEGQ